MSFDWRRYAELAKQITDRFEGTELEVASRRSAVSRYYYSAFCFARNIARDRFVFTSRGDQDDHKDVPIYYEKERRMTHVASRLRQLRIWRNMCDYNDEVDNLPILVENSATSAEDVFKLLAKYSTIP